MATGNRSSTPTFTTKRGRTAGGKELRAWLSADEHARWESAAAELGVSLGDYVRNLTPTVTSCAGPLRRLNVYAAGKIAPNDWRGVDRYAVDRDTWLECVAGRHEPMRTMPDLARRVVYTGPFFVACDHGCYHGPSTHGASSAGCGSGNITHGDVVRASYRGIERADVIYVRIDAMGAYGTAAEVGYAMALGKPFVVDIDPGLAEDAVRDVWFVVESMRQRPADALTEMAVRRVFSMARMAVWDHHLLPLRPEGASDT